MLLVLFKKDYSYNPDIIGLFSNFELAKNIKIKDCIDFPESGTLEIYSLIMDNNVDIENVRKNNQPLFTKKIEIILN